MITIPFQGDSITDYRRNREETFGEMGYGYPNLVNCTAKVRLWLKE